MGQLTWLALELVTQLCRQHLHCSGLMESPSSTKVSRHTCMHVRLDSHTDKLTRSANPWTSCCSFAPSAFSTSVNVAVERWWMCINCSCNACNRVSMLPCAAWHAASSSACSRRWAHTRTHTGTASKQQAVRGQHCGRWWQHAMRHCLTSSFKHALMLVCAVSRRDWQHKRGHTTSTHASGATGKQHSRTSASAVFAACCNSCAVNDDTCGARNHW